MTIGSVIIPDMLREFITRVFKTKIVLFMKHFLA